MNFERTSSSLHTLTCNYAWCRAINTAKAINLLQVKFHDRRPSSFFFPPSVFFFFFPITAVSLISRSSRFRVNTVTGVFITPSSQLWNTPRGSTGLFIKRDSVGAPHQTLAVSTMTDEGASIASANTSKPQRNIFQLNTASKYCISPTSNQTVFVQSNTRYNVPRGT